MATTTTADLVRQASTAFRRVHEDEEAKACMSLTDNLATIVATAETMMELKKIMSYKKWPRGWTSPSPVSTGGRRWGCSSDSRYAPCPFVYIHPASSVVSLINSLTNRLVPSLGVRQGGLPDVGVRRQLEQEDDPGQGGGAGGQAQGQGHAAEAHRRLGVHRK